MMSNTITAEPAVLPWASKVHPIISIAGVRTKTPKRIIITIFITYSIVFPFILAEDVRFELTEPCGSLVFKTSALGLSANLPL